MPHPALIGEVARRLSRATRGSGARIILFGPHTRGAAKPGTPLDLLVIEPKVQSRRTETARLRRELRGLGVPIHLIVVSQAAADASPGGTLIHAARERGRAIAGS